MNLRTKIKTDLEQIVKNLGFARQDFENLQIDRSNKIEFGDYTSNIALILSKKPKTPLQQPKKGHAKIYQSPIEIANLIKKRFEDNDYLKKIEIADPGFINFFIKDSVWQQQVIEILEKGNEYSKSELKKGKKARVEFISANPTGPLHIGNARGGPIGDVIANVLEMNGFDVLKEYLHNDIGGQVEKFGQSLKNIKNGKKQQDQEYKGDYLLEMAKIMPDNLDNYKQAGEWAVEIMLKEIIVDCQKIGIKFDKIYHESQLQKDLQKILKQFEKQKLLVKKDGAVWFAPRNEFLKERDAVVVKSDGLFTYFASDIAYHKEKFESDYDLVIDVLGSNTIGHVRKLRALAQVLDFNLDNFKIILYQFVRVKRGNDIVKMSKRAGNFVTAREVLDEVGKDAFRFMLLAHDPSTHIDFDLELAKRKSQENPVYYVQYAHARISSILRRANLKLKTENLKPDYSLLTTSHELNLIKHLTRLPELVEDLASSFAVHQLTYYSKDLAESFHKFYENCKVISKDREITIARLQLVAACGIILRTALKLLGVSAPQRM